MTNIERYLDAAILKPETTHQEFTYAVRACILMNTCSVCVRPCDLETARELCAGTDTMVCTVLGFPHGVALPASKADEARRYVDLGVDEIDMVANYGWVRSGLWDQVRDDIAGVSAVTRESGIPLKVIFETAQLEPEHLADLVETCIRAEAQFVKTSTGFYGEGAQEEDVRRMLEAAAGRIKVKASGGIRDRRRAERFIAMGCARLGVGWTSCRSICTGAEAGAETGPY